MKKLSFTVALVLGTLALFGQNCDQFIYMQKNKTIEMTSFDAKNKVTFRSVSTVTDVSNADGFTNAVVSTETYDKNNKLLGTSTANYKCSGGVMMMAINMNMQTQNQQKSQNMKLDFKENGNFLEYPANMQVGDHLKDGAMQMEASGGNSGTKMVTTVHVTDRIVLAKETVTTPAGSWDCYKISSKSTMSTSFGGDHADTLNSTMSALDKIRAKLGKMAPSGSRTTENTMWYAPNFGMVKYQGSSTMMELTALK